jgi:hypothetical protein
MKVEREDIKGSFQTILRLIDGNESQELQVYVWEADVIVAKIQGMSKASVLALKNTVSKSVVKEW